MKVAEKLVPELRFPDFEGGWGLKKSKILFQNSRKKGNKSLTIFSVTQDQGLVPRDSLDRKMTNSANSNDNLHIQTGDLAYNMMRMWQGAIGLAEQEGMVSPAYVVLRPYEDVCSDFFINFFDRKRSLYLFTAYSYGLTSDRLRLYYKGFASIPFATPTLPEQKRIALFFSAVDKKIEKLTYKKELLQVYKKEVMQKIFSLEIRFKDDDGKEFPDWEEKSLGGIAEIYDGTHNTPNYQATGIPFYSVEHVTRGDFTKTKFISEEVYLKENNRVKLEKGDILMTRIGDVGTSILLDWDVKASFYVSLALIKQSNLFNPSYLNQYLKSTFFQRAIYSKMIHVAFPKKINLGEIGKCKVLLPCDAEQKKIAKLFIKIDTKIESVQNQITQTQTFKKGLLQKMFV